MARVGDLMGESDTLRKVHLYYVLRDILKQRGEPVPEQCLVNEVINYDGNYTEEDITVSLDEMYRNNAVVPMTYSGTKYYSLR